MTKTTQRFLKLLFVLPGYEPAWALGGVVTATALTAQALTRQGHEVHVLCTNSDGRGGKLDVPIQEENVRNNIYVRYFEPSIPFAPLFDSRSLRVFMRSTIQEYDLVYVAATYQWIGIGGSRIAYQANVPCVMFTAGIFDRDHMNRKALKKRIWYHFFLRRTIDNCDALHLTGEYERKESWAFVNRWPHFLVPHCIDLERFHPNIPRLAGFREIWLIPEGVPVIITSGRTDPIKRLDLLLIALSKIRDKHDFRLVVVGDSNNAYGLALKRLCISLGIQDKVLWVGLIPYSQIPQLYVHGDIFVHASTDENFGMVVAEAMACGLPILVTSGVGLWWSIKDMDVGICTQMQAKDIESALLDFFTNPDLWKARGRRAAKVASQHFSFDNVGRLMSTAFQDVIEGNNSIECSWHLPEKGKA